MNVLNQKENGSYDIDMSQFLPDCKASYVNVPDFEGPIQIVKNIPGKGRGVTALEDIKQGQLVMVSNAFEIDFEGKKHSLRKAISEKLFKNPELRHIVYALHAGDELGHISPPFNPRKHTPDSIKVKGQMPTPPVNFDRIDGICAMNCFESSVGSIGLWIRPSYINHDCIDFNCVWECFGNLHFTRAVRNIRKDQELLISYIDSTEPYESRLECFRHHDFICECRLCLHQKNEDSKSRKRKLQILRRVDGLWNKNKGDLNKIEKDIDYLSNCIIEFKKMGLASEKPEWNFSIRVLFEVLGKLYLRKGNVQAAKVIFENYYQVLNGFDRQDGQGSVCLDIFAARWVVYSAFKCGDLEEARKWIRIFKKDLSSLYGRSDVLKFIEPDLYLEATQNGIIC